MEATDQQPNGRACVFCGSKPVSEEHIWSQWLRKILRKPNELHTHFRTLEGSETRPPRRWRAPAVTTTVKAVCRRCNSQWMSDIENEAKPFLVSMIQGRGRTLYETGQTAVAKWATLKVLAAQGEDPDMPRSHYPAFYRDHLPPEITQVWVGALDTDNFTLLQNRSLQLKAHERPDTPVFKGYGATLTVGHLVLNVFGVEGENPMRRVVLNRLAEALKPIWPVGEPIEWPPPLVMNVGALMEAAAMY